LYDKAEKILDIMIYNDPEPSLYLKRARCRRHLNKFVESTLDLQFSINLGPNLNSTMSSEAFYQLLEQYYRDFDIKYW